MEYPVDAAVLLKEPISLWTRDHAPVSPGNFCHLAEIVNRLGAASAKAQNLRTPVTSFDRLRVSGSQRVYLIRSTPGESAAFGAPESDHHAQNALGGKSAHSQSRVMGLLKVGRKNLFITDALGRQHELSPMCVLDFYVHETCQRKGVGRQLFENMLKRESLAAHQLAYDRPSIRLLSFLDRHYGLREYVPQATNMVLFRQYGLEELQKCAELSEPGRRKHRRGLESTLSTPPTPEWMTPTPSSVSSFPSSSMRQNSAQMSAFPAEHTPFRWPDTPLLCSQTQAGGGCGRRRQGFHEQTLSALPQMSPTAATPPPNAAVAAAPHCQFGNVDLASVVPSREHIGASSASASQNGGGKPSCERGQIHPLASGTHVLRDPCRVPCRVNENETLRSPGFDGCVPFNSPAATNNLSPCAGRGSERSPATGPESRFLVGDFGMKVPPKANTRGAFVRNCNQPLAALKVTPRLHANPSIVPPTPPAGGFVREPMKRVNRRDEWFRSYVMPNVR